MTAKKDLLTIMDFTAEEVRSMLNRSIALKSGADRMKCPLIGKSIGLFFEKPSTRTRVSFEVGVYQLGAQPIVLSPRSFSWGAVKRLQIQRGHCPGICMVW